MSCCLCAENIVTAIPPRQRAAVEVKIRVARRRRNARSRDKEQRTVLAQEKAFQPFNCCNIQMIGGSSSRRTSGSHTRAFDSRASFHSAGKRFKQHVRRQSAVSLPGWPHVRVPNARHGRGAAFTTALTVPLSSSGIFWGK